VTGAAKCRVPVPEIDAARYTNCRACSDFCAYHALAVLPSQVLVFPEICHSCGGCIMVCPEKAVFEREREVGDIFRARSGRTDLVWGELRPGEARTTPLIRAVKDTARRGLTVIDCPPGTSCSMVEAVSGSDFCLLITEPTPFGIHDLDIALRVLEKMEIPRGVRVNKSIAGDEKVCRHLEKKGVFMLMEIPMSKRIAQLYSHGTIFVEEMPEWRDKLRSLLKDIEELTE